MRGWTVTFVLLALLAAPAAAADSKAARSCDLDGPTLEAAVQRFAKLLTYKTVSSTASPNHALDIDEFVGLDKHLREAFPTVFEKLQLEKTGVDELSYLFTWKGSEPSLKPVLFISHVDVVPVDPDTLKDWTYPPFDGRIEEGYVWGRGSMDVKVSVAALLEGITALLQQGYSPRRTLMFAFGQDEEVGGQLGAGKTAELLRSRGVELEVVWDEGTSVFADGFPGLSNHPFAIVATAEKGFQNVEVVITASGGHSSMPPIDGSSVPTVAARILNSLQICAPPVRLQSPTADFLVGIAPYAPAYLRPILSLAKTPGVSRVIGMLLSRLGPEPAALVRTTAAPTRVNMGVGDNVLPQSGSMLINFRLLQGDDEAYVRAYLTSIIGKDMDKVQLNFRPNGAPASNISSVHGPHFALLKKVIQEFWQHDGKPLPVLPQLLPGGTDSKHYGDLSRHGIMRFVPYATNMSAGDLQRVHGTNERLAVDQYRLLLVTYCQGVKEFGEFIGERAS